MKKLLSPCNNPRTSSPTQQGLKIPKFQKQSNTFFLSGELKFDSVPFLWKQSQGFLNDQTQSLTIFDLGGITQSDSSGVALLIAWTREFHRRSKKICFIHLPHQMLAIIRLTGLETIMPIKM